jgi:UDP-N-acetylglucosamine 1-carboxyvinyltransferase
VGDFVVEGGQRLTGTFAVNGAKNAALPILAAATLADGPVVVHNIPLGIRDVQLMLQILRTLGMRFAVPAPHVLEIYPPTRLDTAIPESLMRQMRASLFLAGPLVARTGQVTVSRPGGCDIGVRPIDLHLKGLKALGAELKDLPGGRLVVSAERLRGRKIYLDFPSVGATENIMMAAVLAEGETVIDNAAREPEIVDLAQFLVGLGARIFGAGTDTIRIVGVRRLSGGEHTIVPDRIEAGTVAIAAAITHGDVEITDMVPEHLVPLWRKLEEMGVELSWQPGGDRVRVRAGPRLRATTARTGPHPGFPTDLQPQMVALMTQASGVSTMVETIFENRLKHASELSRMGARILTDGRMAVIYGPTPLESATVEATDLRAGAALILAGLAASGSTRVVGAEQVERGYEDLPRRLAQLGATVRAA